MAPETEIFQTSGGRWIWRVRGSIPVGSSMLAGAAVSFFTKDLVQLDLAAHQAASLVGDRRTMPKERLDAMVRALTQIYEVCGTCRLGPVYWHEPDKSGCNWSVAVASGDNCKECLKHVDPHAFELRNRYYLTDAG